jgi:excisionase family DNA binding protein
VHPKSPVVEQSKIEIRWLTIAEAARYLSCSTQKLRSLLHDGELKAARLGAQYRLDVKDLDNFFTRGKGFIAAYRQGSRPWVSARHETNRKIALRGKR